MSKISVQSLLQGLQQGTPTSKRLFDALMQMSNDLYSLVDVVGEIVLPTLKDVRSSIVRTTYSKTSNVTLTEVTQLTTQLLNKKIYRFEAILSFLCGAGGGIEFQLNGTVGTDSGKLGYQVVIIDSSPAIIQFDYQNALGVSYNAIGDTFYTAIINGFITVTAPGNLKILFAQDTSNGTASSILIGSQFTATEL